ncbi:DUF4190 domain-containing protein [Leifsonia sp. Root112D2]|uniref:DUF4190 domain-containing protein n=1 Tax=Leifsonia sp. Root112D2 TaxID=1736426 RepID=UPI0006FDD40B|nr:DUF4190 domain-containing protein [Leifsonia sp. Root112D2]KQV06433.1 hypothetical protein ASC63_03030 [Leifsonia sp. Root112D2]
MISVYQLAILLFIVLAVALPIVFVVRASRRRGRAIESGELVLQDKTSVLSIVAFVIVFFGAIPGIILGHVALSQLKKTNEKGWGLAVAALWIGYAALGLTVALVTAGFIAALSQHS